MEEKKTKSSGRDEFELTVQANKPYSESYMKDLESG